MANAEPSTNKRALQVLSWVLLAAALGLVGWAVAARFGLVSPPPVPAVGSGPLLKKTPSAKGKNAYLSKDDPSLKIETLPPRRFKIIDVHEHLKGEEEAQRLVAEMDKLGIQRSMLMASTIYTLTLNPIYGFEGFKENNESILAVEKKYPDRFATFVTFNPEDAGNLELVKDYVARGADGVKLYLGHGEKTGKGPFHVMPLDDARMEPFWAWAEEVQLPLVVHINLNKYWDETVRLLEKHPYLRLNIPHFGLHKNSESKLKRMGWLLKRYPNVYTDVSFGFYTFQIEGFEQLGRWRSRSRQWLADHQDKVLFASDMVLEPSKDQPYIENTLRSYMQFLEMERWRFFLVPDYTMHGMHLDDSVLQHIYEANPTRWLLLDDKGNLPDRTRGWPIEGVAVPERPPLPPLDLSTLPPLGPDTKKPAPARSTGEDDDGAHGEPAGGGCEHEPLVDDGEGEPEVH